MNSNYFSFKGEKKKEKVYKMILSLSCLCHLNEIKEGGISKKMQLFVARSHQPVFCGTFSPALQRVKIREEKKRKKTAKKLNSDMHQSAAKKKAKKKNLQDE